MTPRQRQIFTFLRFSCLTSLLGLCLPASADNSMVVEFSGLGQTEVASLKLENGKPIQTEIAGKCAGTEKQVIIEKSLDNLSAGLAEATANGTIFDSVIVYRGAAQFVLENVMITSYSFSSGGGDSLPKETLVLLVADIGNPAHR